MTYLVVKWVHILSSTILFGAGVGSASILFLANRAGRIADIGFALRYVVLADFVFTSPSIVVQLATGFYLARFDGFALSEPWLALALALFVFAGACWLPVVWLQIAMRNMAIDAMANGRELPARYWIYDRWWIALGALAFPAVVTIFWLMVSK